MSEESFLNRDLSRYQRQMLIPQIGEEGQRGLLRGRVAVLGCGALGSAIAGHLVRAGVGFVRLVDRDFVEIGNLQRQVLFDEADARGNLPKVIAAKRKLAAVNSEITLEARIAHIHSGNIEALIDGVDLVLDGTDNFETRFLINEACVKHRKPWIYGGCIGKQGLTMVIVPGETPCLRCVFESAPPPNISQTCETAGILGPAVSVVAALQSMEAIKFLSGNRWALDPSLYRWDVWSREAHAVKVDVLQGKINCPVCRQGIFECLAGGKESRTALMCGKNAVQIFRGGESLKIDLPAMARKLSAAGEVTGNEYLLKFNADRYEITVFEDGRAIVQGTRDMNVARTLYAKYIGV
ncbi:MAG TPA: ThiF family adenylyltransferase [Candidatus Omnitrophota bacterium]|nr:ThiF family adenylyltransferase [Candidatus Omnitrophota bacterium]